MKKVLVIMCLLMIGFTASAVDMWSYAIQLTTTPELASAPGAGTGWYVSLLNASDNSQLASTTVTINNAGLLYVTLFNTPAIDEGLSVYYRIFNNTVASGSWKIDSQSATLQDLSGGFLPGANNVTLSFSGQSWQVVPEPATALLFGIGGMGAWMVRRSKLKSKEEADA
jgi:hypothetical protein